MSDPHASTKLVSAEQQKLEPDFVVELFTLDASSFGGGTLNFFSGTSRLQQNVVWDGVTYYALPIESKGFEYRSRGELPRPRIAFANLNGTISALAQSFDDLLGAKLIRRRTFARHLDGASSPSTTVKFPEDIFYINRKVSENQLFIEFELATSFELDGVMFPRRQVVANLCTARYRSGIVCPFAEDRVVTKSDGTVLGAQGQRPIKDGNGVMLPWSALTTYYQYDVTYVETNGIRRYFILTASSALGDSNKPPKDGVWEEDDCNRKISGCKLRFDPNNQNLPLPFGAFPGAARVPQS